MIIGVGSDILAISRIETVMKNSQFFYAKLSAHKKEKKQIKLQTQCNSMLPGLLQKKQYLKVFI